MSETKVCGNPACGRPLSRQRNESRCNYRTRNYCSPECRLSRRKSAFLNQLERVYGHLVEKARGGEETPSNAEIAAALGITFTAARYSFQTLLSAGRIGKVGDFQDFQVVILGTGLTTAFPMQRREMRKQAAAAAQGGVYEIKPPKAEPKRADPFAGCAFRDDPRAVRDTGSAGMPRRPDVMTYAGNGSAWCA